MQHKLYGFSLFYFVLVTSLGAVEQINVLSYDPHACYTEEEHIALMEQVLRQETDNKKRKFFSNALNKIKERRNKKELEETTEEEYQQWLMRVGE